MAAVVGVEVVAGGGEVGAACAGLVDVEAVPAVAQSLHIDGDQQLARTLGEGDGS